MDAHDRVRLHYSGDDLETVVLGALQRTGVDVSQLRVEDLAGIDQLHAGSVAATEYLLELLCLDGSTRLLDVGCGVGGPARLAADRHGCPVKGIDLSPDFVRLAVTLTDRVGLAGRATFEVGTATALPYEDRSFDRAMINHVGMNLPDKASVFAEVHRVLQPGGLFAVYEQMRIGDGELVFPLPWADDASSSFVESPQSYAELLRAAGFTVESEENRAAAVAAVAAADPAALGPADLFGAGFTERLDNNIVATMTGSLAPVLLIARAG
ncbi:MAG: class I SAM-dependent methyltransferase [Microthrixaceae bacterium]